MRLYEFDDSSIEQLNKLLIVSSQLKDDLEKGISYDWDVDTLLKYLRKYDIDVDSDDLYNLIQTHPLKSVIKNIQGDRVIFKGQQESSSLDQPLTKDKDTVGKMAKKAMKK